MISPASLYRFESLGQSLPRARVLLHHFDGGYDHGQAGALAVSQLLHTLPHERVVTFAADELIDYRSHRPVMTFDGTGFKEPEMPSIVVDLLTDDKGEDLLLLHGTEPDLRWQAFSEAVTQMALSMGVTMAVGMCGMPGAVPHTRPSMVHMHGEPHMFLPRPERPSLLGMEIEASSTAGFFLEYALGRSSIDSRGGVVIVPHYIDSSPYPQGASALLQAVSEVAGLDLPLGDLEMAATHARDMFDKEIAQRPGADAVLDVLEKNFDEMVSVAQEVNPAIGTEETSDADLPTAEEIGARLEAFLESQDTN